MGEIGGGGEAEHFKSHAYHSVAISKKLNVMDMRNYVCYNSECKMYINI